MMSSSKNGKEASSNVFDHSNNNNDNIGGDSGDTATDMKDNDTTNTEYPPDKLPLQPVFCAKSENIQSALLVRMIGEPSLLTRSERVSLEQIVVDSYNDWMQSTCDGYHRVLNSVKLKPIEDLVAVTEVHQTLMMNEQKQTQQQEQNDPLSMPIEHGYEGSLDDTIASGSDGEEKPFLLRGLADTNHSMDNSTPEYNTDPSFQYRPLYWISVSATCRNCPTTDRGNTNLLASDAGNPFAGRTNSSSSRTADEPILASDLVLEEVCFCPIDKKTATTKAISNVTNMVKPVPIDTFFPDAQAPTSVDLLDQINRRIKELREQGSVLHVERLVQLTEPDYAYYAKEMMMLAEENPSNEMQDGSNATEGELHNNTMLPTLTFETHPPLPLLSFDTDPPLALPMDMPANTTGEYSGNEAEEDAETPPVEDEGAVTFHTPPPNEGPASTSTAFQSLHIKQSFMMALVCNLLAAFVGS